MECIWAMAYAVMIVLLGRIVGRNDCGWGMSGHRFADKPPAHRAILQHDEHQHACRLEQNERNADGIRLKPATKGDKDATDDIGEISDEDDMDAGAHPKRRDQPRRPHEHSDGHKTQADVMEEGGGYRRQMRDGPRRDGKGGAEGDTDDGINGQDSLQRRCTAVSYPISDVRFSGNGHLAGAWNGTDYRAAVTWDRLPDR